MSSEIVWGGGTAPEINQGIARFVGAYVPGGHRGFGNHTSMGLVERGVLIAGVVFHNYSPESRVIEFSAASVSKRWLTRSVLAAMFGYAFSIADVVVMRVSEENEMWNGRGIKRILKSYGFTEARIENLRGRGIAEYVYTLTDEAWASNGFHFQQEARIAA